MKGSIEQRSKGSWRLRYDLGIGPDGKRRQGSKTVRGTKKQAEAELARLLHEVNTGSYVDPSRATLGEFLETWLEQWAKPKVAAKTLETYTSFARKHLIPALGQIRLTQLKPAQIQDYYNWAEQHGRVDGKGGLSRQTVKHLHRMLRTALQRALKLGLISRNPCDATDPPQPEPVEHTILSEAETVTLLQATEGSLLYIPLVLAATTGLRRGEILALRWQDVDFARAVFFVGRSLSEAGGLHFKSPKNRKVRLETLPHSVIPVLQAHHARQQAQAQQLGNLWQEYGLVAPRPDGRPMIPSVVSQQFGRLIRTLDLPTITFHELRHTHISSLLARGVPLKSVSSRAGHSSISITADRYGHLLLDGKREVAAVVDDMLSSAFRQHEKGASGAVRDQSVTNAEESPSGEGRKTA